MPTSTAPPRCKIGQPLANLVASSRSAALTIVYPPSGRAVPASTLALMLTTWPLCCFSIWLMARWVSQKNPMPALLTRVSMRPKRSLARLMI